MPNSVCERLVRGLILCAVASFVACRKPLADAGGPHGDRVAKYVPMIEEVVGRPFKTPPKLEIRTRDQVRTFLLAQLEDSVTRRELAGQTATYRALGLIPDTMDLARLFIPLLTEQIGGYYDPKTKVLYVVEGIADAMIGVTIPHELVHALQDQYINLDSIQHITGDDDRQMATHAIIEGQAQYAMFAVLAGKSNIITLLPTWIDEMRRHARESMTIQPVFASSPLVIRESLLFPYINGVDFVGRFMGRNAGGWPLDDPPRSTEQVMHDSAYFGTARDAPATVVLPPVTGKMYENTMGEFGTRLFLFAHLKTGSPMVTDTASLRTAAISASGWSGDRFATFTTGGGVGVAWVCVWDTPQDAAEFVSGLDSALALRYEVSPTKSGTTRTYRAEKRTAVVSVRELGTRMATLYVDVPAGAPTSVLDLGRVVVR